MTAIEQAIQFVYSLSAAVNEDGTEQPALTFEGLHRLGEAVAQVKDSIKAAAIADVTNYGKGEHSIGSSLLAVRAAPGKWDFTGVPGHKEAKDAVSLIEQRAKATHKAKQLGLGAHDVDTGEVLDGAKFTPGGDTIIVMKPRMAQPTAQ